jgi:hypothetical protein
MAILIVKEKHKEKIIPDKMEEIGIKRDQNITTMKKEKLFHYIRNTGWIKYTENLNRSKND